MRTLKFLEIQFLSETEKKARKFSFSESRNAIIGDNKVGKSTLMKSLYYTMGADVTFEDDWNAAKVATLLKFKLDQEIYYIYRKHYSFAVFNSNLILIKTFTKITKELSPFLADLFDFKLKLASSTGTITPTPAFQYLPFFVNQDKSWGNLWAGFDNLTQFSNFKKSLAEYHTGLKPNKYYTLSKEIDDIHQKIKVLESDQKAAINAKDRYEKENPESVFNIDISKFKEEIEDLIKEAKLLNDAQEKYRTKLLNLKNQEIQLDQQASILKSTIAELSKDHEFAIELTKHAHSEVDCPTCGTVFENSFVSRFAIVDDIESCKSMVLELESDKQELTLKIRDVASELNNFQSQHSYIEEILSRKKEEIALNDIISAQGRTETIRAFERTIASYKAEIGQLLVQKREATKAREGTTSPEKQKTIQEHFSTNIKSYVTKLDLPTASVDADNIEGKVKASGSEKPRAMLAYYYAILNTIKDYSSFCYFPIVIDSPNQQDQDLKNRERIFEFVVAQQPKDTQLILGSVELHNESFDGKIIKIEDKRSLLRESYYEEISRDFSKLTDQMYKDAVT